MSERGNQAAADNVCRCSANREICIPIPFLQFCDRKEVTLFKWALPSKTWRILDICTPPIDNTPPLPGNVSAAWQPFEILQVIPGRPSADPSSPVSVTLTHCDSAPQIDWDGFEEPESRIKSYAYCVGSTPSACDYVAMRDVGKSKAATVMDPIYAIEGATVYVVVRCTNTQKLETAVTATIIMTQGSSTFDYVQIRHPVTDDFVTLDYNINEDAPTYTNSTDLDFRIKLSPVGGGVEITGLQWAVSSVPVSLPTDTQHPVGQFDKLKEAPDEPIAATLDLSNSSLVPSEHYYIHFTASNSINRDATWSVLIVYDNTKPVAVTAPAIVQRSRSGWSTALGSLFMCWEFEFAVAPVLRYAVEVHDAISGPIQAVGVPAEAGVVVGTTTSACAVVPQLPLIDGHSYFIRVRATSSAGMSSVNASAPVPVDASAAQCIGAFTANTAATPTMLRDLFSGQLIVNSSETSVVAGVEPQPVGNLKRTYVASVDHFSFLMACGDPHSGIANLTFAITTNATFVSGLANNGQLSVVAGAGPSILPFRSVTPVTNDTQDLRARTVQRGDSDLAAELPEHTWLFGLVAAHNGAATLSAGYSGAIMIDPTPPTLNSSNVALVDGVNAHQTQLGTVFFQQSRTTLRLNYEDAFADDESGVLRFWVTYEQYSTQPSDDLALLWLHNEANNHTVSSGTVAAYNFTELALTDGDVYVMAVSAENRAGLETMAVTPRVMVDGSPPIPFVAWVEDRYIGDRACADVCGVLGECVECAVYQKDRAKITVQWERASDPHSAIKRIELAVVRLPNRTSSGINGTLVAPALILNDVQRSKWTIPMPAGALLQGSTYRVRVTAVNWAEGRTDAFSNTITIDATPPVFQGRRPNDDTPPPNADPTKAPPLQVVPNAATGALEVFVQNPDTYTVEWRVQDYESPVFAYIISLGTAPGDTDIVRQSVQCGTGCGSYPDCTPYAESCDALALQSFEVKDTRVQDAEAVFVFAAVEAINQAGVSMIATTQGRLIDADNPVIGAVIDGWGTDAAFVGVDDGRLYTSWLGVYDVTTAIHERGYAVTSRPDSSALLEGDYTSVPATVGTRMAIVMQLVHGTRYYVHLRVEDKAARFARASSTGVLVDFCAPTVDYIRPVDRTIDLAFTNSSSGSHVCCC